MVTGSADLMPRNLDSRVELVTPILDPVLKAEVMDVIERSLADNTNAWTLDQSGRWTRISPEGASPATSSGSCASSTRRVPPSPP